MNNQEAPVITIDGPGGSGKGTLSLLVANALKWHFLDSGAIYRVLAHSALIQSVDLSDEPGLETLAQRLPLSFKTKETGEPPAIFLGDEEVSGAVRTEACGNAASKIAALPSVRQALLERQRQFQNWPGLVADGRDMGTVVFPEAKTKIFLEASAEERAKRRYFQLKAKGHDVTLQGLVDEIKERDARDKNRAVAPLKPADDASIIDTTSLSIDGVFEEAMRIIHSKLGDQL